MQIGDTLWTLAYWHNTSYCVGNGMALVAMGRCARSVGWMAPSTATWAAEGKAVGREQQDPALLPAGKEPAPCSGLQG